MRYEYVSLEYTHACMKHVHAYTPRNSVPETTIKIANLATYNASNLKTKQPKLTKSIKI